MRAFIALSIAVSTLAIAAPASAGHVKFHYNTSELATNAGTERLYDRIRVKAESVCSISGAVELWRMRAEAECADLTVDDIVAAIGDRGLTTLHANAGAERFAARR